MANVGLKVEYSEVLCEAEYRGSFKTVSDKEHGEIVTLNLHERLSMKKIADCLGRSSRTPLLHIHLHNEGIERSGFCAACNA